MTATAMASSAIGRVRVERARVELILSREHPAPERVRARFDDIASKELGPALARAAAATLSDGRGGLWLFRRLDVAFDANTDWDADVIAEAWTAALRREVGACLAAGRADDVQWFPHRAALVARFASDLARGVAWGRWIYAGFAGLRGLPMSAAIRTALLRDGDAWSVLEAIEATEVASVCAALTAADAARILTALEVDDGGAELADWTPLARAFAGELADGTSLAGEPHLALRTLARAAREGAQTPGLAAGARAAACLASLVAQALPSHAAELLAAARRGELAALAQAGGVGAIEALAALARAGEAARHMLADALAVRAGVGVAAGEARHDVSSVGHTLAGGAFLLLPLLDELPLDEATAAWPGCEDSGAAAVMRLLVLAQALGGQRAPAAFADPLLRDLTGVGPRAHGGSLADWSRAVSRAALGSFTDAMASWGRAAGALGAEALVVARAPLGAGHRLVLLDGARGQWMALGALGRRSSRRPERWLRAACAPFAGGDTPRLYFDDGLAEAAVAVLPASQPLAGATVAPDEGPATLADVIARLPALADDLAHLAVPRAWDLGGGLSDALVMMAQALLRAFAWRIPGFAHASLRHLHANFLDVRATVEDEPDRRVVRLGRAPLHLVLAMTGMARATYRLSWTDDRPFTLFPSS